MEFRRRWPRVELAVDCAPAWAAAGHPPTTPNAILAHLATASLFFVAITWLCACRFSYTGPLQTALPLLVIVVMLDVLTAAVLIPRSCAMFTSLAGVWPSLLLILVATYRTARLT